jgi:cadmium resistance protein CadD (predicted permease)
VKEHHYYYCCFSSSNVLILLSLLALLFLLFVPSALSLLPKSYAHFDHFSLYNGRGDQIGSFYVYEALDPDYARPGEPTSIMFSIQDKEGNDVANVNTMVEVYSGSSGERIQVYPWTKQKSGDFEIPYIFPEIGSYQIVLSIANGPVNSSDVNEARAFLSSNRDCNCNRAIFNVSISEGFGTIWNSMMLVSLLVTLALIGIVLGITFRNRMKKKNKEEAANGTMSAKLSAKEYLKYTVMLVAIAGGIVHLMVYSMHASLRLEYSIFLISAGGMQVAYGVLYTFVTITNAEQLTTTTKNREHAKRQYRRTLSVNLFGLVGSCILLGLYTYSVIFPPPLSPTNVPDKLEFAGILAKSLEAFLVIGIVYLIRWEKSKIKNQTIRIN